MFTTKSEITTKPKITSGKAQRNSSGAQLWHPDLCPVPRYQIPPEERWPRPCASELDHSLVGPVDLTPEQVAFYHEHGFIHGPFRLFSEAEMHAILLRLYAIEAQKKAQRVFPDCLYQILISRKRFIKPVENRKPTSSGNQETQIDTATDSNSHIQIENLISNTHTT